MNYTFNITLEARKPIILQGMYKADGNVLILPITGNGTCRFSLGNSRGFSCISSLVTCFCIRTNCTNSTYHFVISDDYKSFSLVQMKPKVKNGNTFMEIDDLSWKFTTSRLHMRLNNLFGGDKLLGERCTIIRIKGVEAFDNRISFLNCNVVYKFVR